MRLRTLFGKDPGAAPREPYPSDSVEQSENKRKLIKPIQEDLLSNLYNFKSHNAGPETSYTEAFITLERLHSIWDTDNRLADVLSCLGFPLAEKKPIRDRYIQILSLTVYIDAVTMFRKIYHHLRSRNPRLTDQDLLDINKDDLPLNDELQRKNFLVERYIFCPHVITQYNVYQRVELSKEVRLPFVDRIYIDSGAYGDVQRVEIPVGYIKPQDPSLSYSKPQVVACKETRVRADWHSETDKLDILRESLATHAHIMLHRATLTHGDNYLILLPFAAGDDLNKLLNAQCDINSGRFGDTVACLRTEGPEKQLNVTRDLLEQSENIADALSFLHHQLKVGKDPHAYCAHMDLKPGNILIEFGEHPSQRSTVGKWKLSDFGLSAFDRHGKMKRDVVTAGNVPVVLSASREDRTMHANPPRRMGTYQAPEVDMEGGFDVGRRSDVWSLVCVFSEVITYAFGGPPLVNKFREARYASQPPNDYFHSKDSTGTFILRPEVGKWLDWLETEFGAQGFWLQDATRVVRKYLTFPKRPDSQALYQDLYELRQRFNSHRAPMEPIGTGIGFARSRSSSSHVRTAGPSLRFKSPRDKTAKASLLHPEQGLGIRTFPSSQNQPGGVGTTKTAMETQSLSSPQPQASPSSPNAHTLGSQDATSQVNPVILRSSTNGSETVLSSSSSPSPNLSQPSIAPGNPNSTSGGRQQEMIDFRTTLPPHRRRRIGSTESFGFGRQHSGGHGRNSPQPKTPTLSFSGDAVSVSVDPDGSCAVWLFPTCVRVVECKYFKEIATFNLDESVRWKRALILGRIVVAWGSRQNPRRDQVCFCHLDRPDKTFDGPPEAKIPTLMNVSMSRSGNLVFVCENSIWYATTKYIESTAWQNMQPLVTAPDGHFFSDGIFSDDGKILYVWSYGRRPNLLHLWRVEDHNITPYSPVAHDVQQINDPKLKLLPYDLELGCIMQGAEAPGFSSFFPAQFPHSNGNQQVPGHVHETTIKNVLCAKVFQNLSLITIERRSLSSKHLLKEYLITCVGDHQLSEKGTDLCKLKSKVTVHSAIALVRAPTHVSRPGRDYVIVCNTNSSIEIVQFGGTAG